MKPNTRINPRLLVVPSWHSKRQEEKERPAQGDHRYHIRSAPGGRIFSHARPQTNHIGSKRILLTAMKIKNNIVSYCIKRSAMEIRLV
jgi:hypothetical protein